jgi:hypothetical protein
MVDESLYTDDDPPQQQGQSYVQTKVKEEMDVKLVHPVHEAHELTEIYRPLHLTGSPKLSFPPSRGPSELPVSTGDPSRNKSESPLDNFARPQLSPNFAEPAADSFMQAPDSSPAATPIPLPSEETPTESPFGQLPTDPHLAKLFVSACEQWKKIKQSSGVSASTAQAKDTSGTQIYHRGSSHDPLDVIATPERIYEPLARRPRHALDASGGSVERGPKRRKLSDGFQRGIRSKVPSVLVPAPGAVTYSRSTDDLKNVKTMVLDASSASAPSTPNATLNPVFTFIGEPVQFWLQVDLPDRGGVIRLIRVRLLPIVIVLCVNACTIEAWWSTRTNHGRRKICYSLESCVSVRRGTHGCRGSKPSCCSRCVDSREYQGEQAGRS